MKVHKTAWAIAACISLMAFISCENDLSDVNRLFSVQQTSMEVVRDFEMFYSDSAIVRVKVTGPTMIRHLEESNPRQEFPDGIKMEFFDLNQRINSRLTSKYAVRYEQKGEVIVRDSVVWKSMDEQELDTEELIWNEKEGRVYTDKFVTIQRPDEIIYGVGFEANQDFNKARIKAIEGRIRLDENIDQ